MPTFDELVERELAYSRREEPTLRSVVEAGDRIAECCRRLLAENDRPERDVALLNMADYLVRIAAVAQRGALEVVAKEMDRNARVG